MLPSGGQALALHLQLAGGVEELREAILLVARPALGTVEPRGHRP